MKLQGLILQVVDTRDGTRSEAMHMRSDQAAKILMDMSMPEMREHFAVLVLSHQRDEEDSDSATADRYQISRIPLMRIETFCNFMENQHG